MKCLAVNTANTVLSLALVEGDKSHYRFDTPETRDQGNLLLNHAKAALDQAGWDFKSLDLLAVVTGPGSFTGIRIGLSAMRGLALASGVPLVGISSFDLYARSREGLENIIAIESWREELYLQRAGHAPVNQSPEEFVSKLGTGNFLISGDARQKLEITGATYDDTDASAIDVARIAIATFKEQGAGARPVPFYLRDADVTLSSKNRKTEGI